LDGLTATASGGLPQSFDTTCSQPTLRHPWGFSPRGGLLAYGLTPPEPRRRRGGHGVQDGGDVVRTDASDGASVSKRCSPSRCGP